jgi:hypothetical protein
MSLPPGLPWSVGGAARDLAVAWSEQPALYVGPAVIASCAVLVSAALAAAPERLRVARARAGSRGLFATLVVVTILLGRWPGLALTERSPDESEDIASAWALCEDPRYGISADNHTHGPLALASSLLPLAVGWPIEYGSIRAVGLAMSMASCLLVYGMLAARFLEPVARAAAAPLALFLAWVGYSDYIAFNAEQPAMFLLLVAGFLAVRLGRGPESHAALRALACGAALGSVPLVKLQAGPLGATVAALAAVLLLRSGRAGRRRLLLLVAGAALPSVLLATYLVRAGIERHFWTNYVVSALEYSFVQPWGVFWPWLRERLADEWFVRFFVASTAAGLMATAMLAVRRRLHSAGTLLACLCLLVVALFSVYRSGHNYLHYMTFVHYPLALANGAAFAAVAEGLSITGARSALAVLFLAVNGLAPLWPSAREAADFLRLVPHDQMQGQELAREILRYASSGDRLAIWGFAPRYYVLTGLRPGTRYGHSGNAQSDPYFFRLYLEDFDRSRPPVFVDAEDAIFKAKLDDYPELAGRIARDYEQVAMVGATRLYVSRARLRALANSRPNRAAKASTPDERTSTRGSRKASSPVRHSPSSTVSAASNPAARTASTVASS